MQNKDREDNAFPFVMLLVILLGLASLELKLFTPKGGNLWVQIFALI